jgi:hypothetical protein
MKKWYQKTWVKILAVLFVIGLIGRLATEEKHQKVENTDAALEALKKEPKILDLTLTDAKVLYVSVKDDGTRRDGYAEYVCGVLKEHGVTGKRVKIIKHGSQNDPNKDNAYGVLLGEKWCDK